MALSFGVIAHEAIGIASEEILLCPDPVVATLLLHQRPPQTAKRPLSPLRDLVASHVFGADVAEGYWDEEEGEENIEESRKDVEKSIGNLSRNVAEDGQKLEEEVLVALSLLSIASISQFLVCPSAVFVHFCDRSRVTIDVKSIESA